MTNTVYPVDPSFGPPKPKYRFRTKHSGDFEVRAVAAAVHAWPQGHRRRARCSPGGESFGFFKDSGESGLGSPNKTDGYGGTQVMRSFASNIQSKRTPTKRPGTDPVDSHTDGAKRLFPGELGSSSEDGSSESDSEDFSSDSEGQDWLADVCDTRMKVVASDSGFRLGDKLENGLFTVEEALEVLRSCAGNLKAPHRKIMLGQGRYVILGLYNQGGFNGVTSYARRNGDLVRYLNKFVACQGLDHGYTTLYLSLNASAPLHRDVKNEHSVPVWILALGDFLGGGLWVEGRDNVGPVVKTLPNGEVKAGSVLDVHNKPHVFDGRVWHCTESWLGKERWVIVAYVPRGSEKVIGNHLQELEDLGFPVGRVSLDSVTGSGDLGSEAGIANLKCNEAAVSLACASPLDIEEDSWDDIHWEIDFPCEVLERDWQEGAVSAHVASSNLCRALTLELSDTRGDARGTAELFNQLKAACLERDWYEGLLWQDYLEQPGVIVRALKTEIPLNEGDVPCAAEVFLQTRNVSIAEARKELPLWVSAATEEVHSLEVLNEAVLRIETADIEQLAGEGKRIIQVPGKAVLTRKAGIGKRRFRCVACGNYVPAEAHDSMSLYASGVEGLTVRTALAYAAYVGWSALSSDIRTAFLHAPLTDDLDPEEIIIVRPPSLLVEMKILEPNHRWRVLKALYGLRQAPLAWARFRDKSLRALTFQCGGVWYALRQGISDDSLWFIVKSEVAEGDAGRWHGILIIYVDDLLGFASSLILKSLFDEIQNLWQLSDPEWIGTEAATKFCGLEIQALEGGGYRVSQRSYLQELFTRYEIQSSAAVPLSQWCDPEEEHDAKLETIREAQALTGALLWASSKSRPDIAFAVSKLGQFAVKAPSVVIQKGYQVLRYLYGTADLWIEYQRQSGNGWLDAPVPRTLGTLKLFTDASHAPEGGRSCQAIFIVWCGMLLCWECSKQPFVNLSSAESELVAVIAGVVAAESVAAIVEELICQDVLISALCDNQASVRSFAVGSLGWRSRHLRMRAAACRERTQAGSLVVTFVPGDSQLADLATKPLGRPRILYLLGRLGLKLESKEDDGGSARAVSRLSVCGVGASVRAERLAGLALLAVLPSAEAQPSEPRVAGYDLFVWLLGVVMTFFALLWAWLLVYGPTLHPTFGSVLQSEYGQPGVEVVPDEATESCTPSVEVQEIPGVVPLRETPEDSEGALTGDDSDSDVFDAEEWESSRQALVKRELYTGLTFVQRAKLRQQLVKGDIVDVPNMMQRYGPAPSWYTGVDPDDPGPQTSVPTPNFQVGGSSSSSDPLGPGVQIGGSSSAPSDHGLQIGGSSSGPSDSFSAVVSRIVVTDLCDVLERHLGVLLALIGRSSPSWLRLRRVSNTFWHNRALCFVAELQDTGSVPTLIGAGFSATFQFVQNGDQFSWVPVSLVVQGQVEAGVASGEGAGTAAQPTVTESTYEDLCEIGDASDAYFQAGGVPFGGDEDSELGIEVDEQNPYVQWPLPGHHAEWPPRDPGQWGQMRLISCSTEVRSLTVAILPLSLQLLT